MAKKTTSTELSKEDFLKKLASIEEKRQALDKEEQSLRRQYLNNSSVYKLGYKVKIVSVFSEEEFKDQQKKRQEERKDMGIFGYKQKKENEIPREAIIGDLIILSNGDILPILFKIKKDGTKSVDRDHINWDEEKIECVLEKALISNKYWVKCISTFRSFGRGQKFWFERNDKEDGIIRYISKGDNCKGIYISEEELQKYFIQTDEKI